MSAGIEISLAIILLSVLFSLSSSRLMTLIKLMALQGALVSLLPVLLNSANKLPPGGIALFLIMLLIKAILIPALLYFALTRMAIRREVEPLIGYHASVVVGLGLILLATYLSRYLQYSAPGVLALMPITAITALGGGLFLMMSRTKALTQVIGYLMLDNGIYLMGTALIKRTHSHYLVELGVLLDLLVAVMIMGIILNNINRAFDDVDTLDLEQLKD
ncbi:MAG: hydrogenase [Desulfobulbaceae bacterium]|nr:hydrogenase [Desulfobulbaceae bacterium]